MPPKSKQPANGKTDSKPKTTTPAAAAANAEASETAKSAPTTVTKPDTAAYQAEQDALKKEIEQYQAKLVCFLPVVHRECET
jgi:hypothetical protein